MSMKVTSLQDALDQIRPELEPLDAHYMAQQDELVRVRYLTFLVANLLEEGPLSEAQSRLLDMLLVSIKANKTASLCYQQAATVERDDLKEIVCYLKKDKGVANAFLFDLMVLMRVAKPLSVQSRDRLSRVASVICFHEDDLNQLLFWCMVLLMGEGGDVEVAAETIQASCNSHRYIDLMASNEIRCGDIIDQQHLYYWGVNDNYDRYWNVIDCPSGIVTKVYKKAFFKGALWASGDRDGDALDMVILPVGLTAWWPTIKSAYLAGKKI